MTSSSRPRVPPADSRHYDRAMRLVTELLRLSATDLANHLGCVHLSLLDLAVAEGRARRPHRNDPIVELLAERGREHEAKYLTHLRAQKLARRRDRVPPRRRNVETTLKACATARTSSTRRRSATSAGTAERIPHQDEWREPARRMVVRGHGREARDRDTRGTILQLCVYSICSGDCKASARGSARRGSAP